MYHLSGISSLTSGGRSRSNSLVSCPSTPLSPSVLDFSEYVSRQCEKKLQRRVRQLTQKTNRQLATIQKLKRQLTNSRTPLTDVSNTITATQQTDDAIEGRADETAEEAALLDGSETEEEAVEGEEAEERDTIEQTRLETASGDEGETTADGREKEQLDDWISHQREGQQHTTALEQDETHASLDCPPCSPIPVGRHKRGRTDDSEQCNTDLIDAQWKKTKEDDDTTQPQHLQQAANTHSTAAVPVVHGLLPFKAALLHPFPMSHIHVQSGGSGGSLTPYRGLLRPFTIHQNNHSPLRVEQPAL